MPFGQGAQRLELPRIGFGTQHFAHEGDRRPNIARSCNGERVGRSGDRVAPGLRGLVWARRLQHLLLVAAHVRSPVARSILRLVVHSVYRLSRWR
jgi:hypothetical protein